MGSKDDDPPEMDTWSCNICGMSGSCRAGDASMAEAVHKALAHPKGK